MRDGFSLTGTKSMVPLGMDAELMLVIAELEDAGPAAFIVEGTPEGMTRTAGSQHGPAGRCSWQH